MNSERIAQRKLRRKITEKTLTSFTRFVPYEIFRAGAFTSSQADNECTGYNSALEQFISKQDGEGFDN